WQKVLRDPKILQADIRDHLLAENAYFDGIMADAKPLQETMFAEMKGRLKQDDASVPEPDGPFAYYSRYAVGAQHPLYARTPRDGGKEEVLLDVDAQAKGKAFYQVSATGHSPDHKLYAYAEDDKGAGIYRILVKDLATGALVGTPIENASGDFVFSPDGAWLFWTFTDENARPVKVFRRPARGGTDTLVYEEKDPGMFLSVGLSRSRAFILISIANQETSEVHTIPANTPTAAPVLFAPRQVAQLYTPVHYDGRWYIHTNADGAVDFKIMSCELGKTDRASWKDYIPHQPGRYIESMTVFANYMVRLERNNALPRIVVRAKTGAEHAIEQTEAAFALQLDEGYEFETNTLRFVYQSPSTPRQWFDYDLAKRTRDLRKTQEVPSGHDASRYLVERFFIKAKDGAEIPVTTLRLKTTAKGSGAPVMLYAYGSYGIGTDASFNTNRFSIVDRGWVFAIAHVRGGDEKGRGWFEDGRKAKKINTFTDFIAVAEGLVARGDAKAGRIVSYGGSAGGLLVGAVSNLAPDGLFAGHIAAVPFVDVINTMSDETLPLTPPEWPEWGNPLKSAADYDTMLAYSPYDNVAKKPYPPIFAYGGLTDSRVTYWEPAKWVALLRERAPEAGPYLLHINMDAGHGGASGRFDRLKEVARDFAFALKAVGDKAAGAPLR
ncbi:MAG TPA: S9 family peptidase, partial [Alphaproteobacteria bacterium]|nr:S9 family peptidase [Alphaproteobacteria bacterium]